MKTVWLLRTQPLLLHHRCEPHMQEMQTCLGADPENAAAVEAALVLIPWNEAEMWKALLGGCGAKWLSRQLSAQGEKAARRQTVMGIRRQDAIDGKRARATIRQFSTELCRTNSAKSVLLWRTMPSIAHFYSSPTISPS